MAVGLKVDFLWYPIGTGDFVHSFFSTICYNLEGGKWGSRFPYLMNSLYQGELSYNDLDSAKEELTVIIEEFKEFSPDQVIWDIEDLSKQPPWGNNISPEIKNLSDYFITCDGENIFDEIIKAFKEAKAEKQNIILTSL